MGQGSVELALTKITARRHYLAEQELTTPEIERLRVIQKSMSARVGTIDQSIGDKLKTLLAVLDEN